MHVKTIISINLCHRMFRKVTLAVYVYTLRLFIYICTWNLLTLEGFDICWCVQYTSRDQTYIRLHMGWIEYVQTFAEYMYIESYMYIDYTCVWGIKNTVICQSHILRSTIRSIIREFNSVHVQLSIYWESGYTFVVSLYMIILTYLTLLRWII